MTDFSHTKDVSLKDRGLTVDSGPYELATLDNHTHDLINITAIYLRKGQLVKQIEVRFVDKVFESTETASCQNNFES